MNIQYKIPSALVMQRVTLELSSVVSLELSIVVSFRLDTHFRAITVDNQQDATILIYLLLISSTYFGRCFCNGVSYWVEQVPPNTKHQPAATSVENTTSCSYSDLLLMMGENFARNM
jgi:hypothetical protein